MELSNATSIIRVKTDRLTNATQQSPSCEANGFSQSPEIPRILWNSKFHYRIHKNLPPVPILSQISANNCRKRKVAKRAVEAYKKILLLVKR
jgi:hypothetical protein